MKAESRVQRNVKLAITIGDPAGVGCEVALRALEHIGENITPVLVGRRDVIEKSFSSFLGNRSLSDFSAATAQSGSILVYDIQSDLPIPAPGQGSVDTAKESLSYVDASISLWRNGLVDAIVTGPVNKGLIEKSGTRFMGHTEYFAEKIGEADPFMMMYSSTYRVLLATTHVPLSAVPGLLSVERILKTIRTAHKSLSAITGKKPSIAVCGLDPHCGDGGAIGTFDDTVTAQAIGLAVAEGIDARGPFPSDTLFMKNKWKNYDIAVALYHDQGLIPFKVLAFDEGVNVTLGLSLIRTSVDHGTAYDIAGKGLASAGSMVEAINLAASLVRGSVNS